MKTATKKSDVNETTQEATEPDVQAAHGASEIDPKELISNLRDEIASIEAGAELIPTYYKTGAGLKPRGHHTGNERARCFREATLLQLAYARGWLGKALGALGNPTPYPQSDNPENPTIEPPAYQRPVIDRALNARIETADTVAVIKGFRQQCANAIADVKVLCDGQPFSTIEPGRYFSLSITALEAARLSLGEELGILGGH